MSKTKINLKLIIALFGLALVMCLVPLGVQALATDEATDAAASNNEGEPAAPANDQEYIIVNQKEGDTELGQLITRREDRKFTLADGETVDTEVNGPIGYLYVNHLDGSKTCVAAAFSDVIYNENLYKFKEWTSIENTYTANYEVYTPASSDGYYYAGQMRDNNVPIEGVEASWVDPKSGTRINTYSNDLGMACLTIPYGISGSIHVVRDGYVSDFSIPQTYKVGDVPSFTVVDMMKGAKNTVNSSIANTKFHVHEYVSNNSIRPSFEYLAEDIYLNEVPTRMLPEGANMMVLTDAVCDKYGLNHGTLYYSYEGPLPLGASLYEIVFEPDANYKCDSWTRTDSSSSVVMEVGKDYPIMLAGGPYIYTVNLSEKTKAAQTGDDNLPIVIALIVLACACGGYIAYRKLRKK